MNQMLAVLSLSLLSTLTFGQTNHEKFRKLFKENDTTQIKALLADWEKTNANDPELYTTAINFYFSDAKMEVISIDNQPNSNEGLQLLDSTGNTAAYLHSNVGYDPQKLNKALDYANRGIARFPDRLDIRLGKCYLLQQIAAYDSFTTEVIRTIDYSAVNKNNWLWTENQKQPKGQEFLLDAVQSYMKGLYDTENDALLHHMIQIGEGVLKYYPNSIEILSTTSVALLLTKQYDAAIGYLKKAEQLNPQDYIVLNNIAQAYKVKGDKENAIKYYRLTEKYGTEQAKQQALQHIEQLEK